MNNKKDYYKILGIERNASEEEIKSAYKELIKKYHPDKEGGDEEKAKEVNVAYEVLIDKDKRNNYDSPPQPNFPFGEMNMNDIFFKFAFGGRGFENMTSIQQISKDITLTLKEVLFEKEIEIEIKEIGQKIKFELPADFKCGGTYQIQLSKSKRQTLIIHLKVNV